MSTISLVRNLSDRILFAVGLLLFMQAPQFVDQYTQRLGGYLQGQQEHLARYQNIADQQLAGDLASLIGDFNASEKSSVREVGNNVSQLIQQIDASTLDLQILEQGRFVSKVVHLALNMNLDIAGETLRIFTPGIPISLEGIICGLSGGILLSALFHLLMRLCSSQMRVFKTKPRPVKKRVEPRI